MVKIGNKVIDTNVFLAPLSACSDLPFRMIAREHGARFCFFEMLDAQSVIYKSPRALEILQTAAGDDPIAGQLLGSEPEMMLKAAHVMLERANLQFLDINAACPARKVVKKGAGSCFFREPERLYRVVEYLASRLPLPITVKLRVGLNQVDADRAAEIAKGCEASGAAAMFVHGRTRVQENFGEVSYAAIRTVKQAVKIPVFGSGNVLNPALAKKMLDEAQCDGVLVAKGSFGNPWIYRDIENFLANGTTEVRMDLSLKLATLKKHLGYIRQYKERETIRGMGLLGKISMWYLKGFAEASRLRAQVFSAKNYDELLEIIDGIGSSATAPASS